MKNSIRSFFIISMVIIIGSAAINQKINAKIESNIEYKDSLVEVEESIKDDEIEQCEEAHSIKENEYNEEVKSDSTDKDTEIVEKEEEEEVEPLYDNSIDIMERISNYLEYDINSTSFIYYNLKSEEILSFNEDLYMNAASLYKLGLNLVVYNMVDNGEVTLDDLVYYSPWQFQSGTGILQYDTSFGALPLGVLLEYSIKYSDNIAATMIYSYIGGWNNFKWRLFELLGIDYGNYDNITSARVEFEALKYLYNNKDNPNYATLIENMKNTDFHDRLDKYLTYDEVAHKIGSDEGYTHDVGIVFTDEPYIIVMMTDNVYNGADKIADISKAIYLYNKESSIEKESTDVKPQEYQY